MPRIARVVVPGFSHHVPQRGNRRQRTFFCNEDYQAYIDLMADWCRRCGRDKSTPPGWVFHRPAGRVVEAILSWYWMPGAWRIRRGPGDVGMV